MSKIPRQLPVPAEASNLSTAARAAMARKTVTEGFLGVAATSMKSLPEKLFHIVDKVAITDALIRHGQQNSVNDSTRSNSSAMTNNTDDSCVSSSIAPQTDEPEVRVPTAEINLTSPPPRLRRKSFIYDEYSLLKEKSLKIMEGKVAPTISGQYVISFSACLTHYLCLTAYSYLLFPFLSVFISVSPRGSSGSCSSGIRSTAFIFYLHRYGFSLHTCVS